MFVFGKRGCLPAMWLYSVKSVFIREKVVVLGQSGCIGAKVVVFGQTVGFGISFVVFGQKWLYSCKMVVFGKSDFILANCFVRAKVVVFVKQLL